MIDRRVYFDRVRDTLFAGAMSQQQVDGQDAILNEWTKQDLRWLAYMLATVYHETAKKMWPIEEYGKGSGKPYGVKDKETGQAYYGRGFIQLTWRDNYSYATKALDLKGDDDLEWHAAKALDLEVATEVMFRGMSEGWFTGNMLGDFFNANVNEPVNARSIINTDVEKNGELVASYHGEFLRALEEAETERPMEAATVQVAIVTEGNVKVTVIVNGETLAG